MSKGPFEAQSFVPTQFSSAEDKAKVRKHFPALYRFLMERQSLHEVFYNWRSNCFGHIAHYVEGMIMGVASAMIR